VDPEDRYHSASRPLVLTSILPTAALDLTLYEVTNILGARKRQHGLAESVCRSILERCDEHVACVDAQLVEMTVNVIAEHDLTAYDAAYVAAARRHDWTLVSTDLKDLVDRGLAVTPDAVAPLHLRGLP
jgi:predicted nucleic acid-binding protein